MTGALCARALGLRLDAAGAAYRLLLGFALCANAILALGSYSLIGVQFSLLAFAVLALGVDLRLASRRRRAHGAAEERRGGSAPEAYGAFERLCVAVTGFVAICALIGSLAPSTAWDAAVAHLALPAAYTRMGAMGLLEGNAYSAYPHFMHSVYTAAFGFGGDTAAALCNAVLALAGVGLMQDLGRRLAGRRCGWIAAAMFVTAPIFIDQAGSASIDLAFSVYTLAALHALTAWRQDNRTAWLVCAALFAGSSCGIRHTGYLTCALMIAWTATAARPGTLRAVAGFAVLAAAGAAPWLLRSYLLTGNAVYPFFADGGGPADPEITALAAHESVRGGGLVSFALFPARLIMQPYLFDGLSQSPGPWPLVLGAAGLLFGAAATWRLGAFAIAGGACLFFFRQYARYYLPFFTAMFAVAAVGAERSPWWRRTIAALLSLSFLYGAGYAAAAVHFKIPAALGIESRSAYLTRRVERYAAYEWLNANLPAGATVLTTDMRGFYIKRPVFQNLEALYPIMNLPVWEQVAWMKDRGISYWLYCDAYVEESPGFREKGLYYVFQRWRNDPRFVLVKRFALERPGGGSEIVELYNVRYD